MSDLRFDCHEQSFQPNIPAHQFTLFRHFELEENHLFKADNKEYVHFFFLIEGEMKISGVKSTKSVIMPDEFFFIPNSKFVCRAIKESKFILFSINRFHYQANKDMFKSIMPVVSKLKHQYSPIIAPPILSVFIRNLPDYLKNVDSPLLQYVKQQELLFIFHSFYTVGSDNNDDIPMYGRLSLS